MKFGEICNVFNDMKTILVPTDFSEYSRDALDFALQFAENTGSEVHLLHIIDSPVAHTFSTLGIISQDKRNDEYDEELVRIVKSKIKDLTLEKSSQEIIIVPEVFIGKPYENISKHISQHAADLIIMGTKGCSGLKEFFIGSNTEKVVRYSKCPVISIPEPVNFADINEIVFATDLIDDDGKVIESIKTFQKIFDARISLLWVNTIHIIQNEEEIKNNLEKLARDHNLEKFSINVIKGVSAEIGIMNFVEKVGADLIAMATSSRHGLAHIFSGSLAEDIVNHSQCPIWTLSVKV